MTDHDIAAGLFKLAKAHRRNAHNMRRRANLNVKANRLAPAAIKLNAREAAKEVRLRADEEAMKGAFLAYGATLAKLGATFRAMTPETEEEGTTE